MPINAEVNNGLSVKLKSTCTFLSIGKTNGNFAKKFATCVLIAVLRPFLIARSILDLIVPEKRFKITWYNQLAPP